jgi:MarR family transcriptional regulator, temperature-dependent positive regulator of motility
MSVNAPTRSKVATKNTRSSEIISRLSAIFRNNEIMFGYRIGYLSNYFSGPVYSLVEAQFGMRRPKFATLFCIGHLKKLSARDISLLTGIPKNSLSRAVNELLREGRIKRTVDSADSRRAILTMTRQGRDVYEQILPMFQAREQAMMAPLTQREAAQFDRLLAKMVLRDDGWNEVY